MQFDQLTEAMRPDKVYNVHQQRNTIGIAIPDDNKVKDRDETIIIIVEKIFQMQRKDILLSCI